jgi:thiamine transporter
MEMLKMAKQSISVRFRTKRIAVSAIMIALGTILSIIPLGLRLPFGGQVTPMSMAPVMLVCYIYGIKWGLLCSTAYGTIQAIIGIGEGMFAAQSWWRIILIALLDYVLAYAAMCLAPAFKKLIKSPQISIAAGAFTGGIARLACHFISGILIWSSYAQSTLESVSFGQKILDSFSGAELVAVYSILYNGSFLLPDLILTIIGLVILISVKPVRQEALRQS